MNTKTHQNLKRMYEELVESFQYIVDDLFDYVKKNKIDLPNRVYRNIQKAQKLIEYRISRTSQIVPSYSPTESQQRNKTTDEETEPNILTEF